MKKKTQYKNFVMRSKQKFAETLRIFSKTLFASFTDKINKVFQSFTELYII